MQVEGIIEALPLWALYIITAAIVLLSAEAGWRLGNYMRQRPPTREGRASWRGRRRDARPAGLPAGVHLRMAASRYDARKQLVLQEANAIGTTYLRATCCRSRSAAKSATCCASMRRCAWAASPRS